MRSDAVISHTRNMREKNAVTGNNVWGQGQSGQVIKLFQARRKISFPFHI